MGAGAGSRRESSSVPLALYVHLPWCVRKCPYCDFNSHAAPAVLPEHAYLAALLADLSGELARAPGRRIGTVFLGGGTPSLFTARTVRALLAALADTGRLARTAEITLEANPGTLETGRLAGFRRAGVNRVSLGVQSFDDGALHALGRIHDAAQARAALRAVARAGYARWNVDLMYALPGQDAPGALGDVETALALGAPHISHYQLTVEPGTAFHRRPPALPDETTVAAIERACRARLRAAGLARYEVSAWARPGQRCRHNLNYWRFGDYLGIGAGAHGKLTQPDGTVMRRAKCRNPQTYMARAGQDGAVESEHRVGGADLPFEFAMNALRLPGGFTPAQFTAHTGLRWEQVAPRFAPLAGHDLVRLGRRVRTTARGYALLDGVLAQLLPEPA